MSVKAIWRDDDYSFFSNPDDLKRLVDVSSRFGTLCVAFIPRLASSADVMYDIPTEPINQDEIRHLVKNGRVEIWMHGITHSHNGGPEFDGSRAFEKRDVINSKKMLERYFDVGIPAFVPPHNSISKNNFLTIADCFGVISTSFCHMPNERPATLPYMKKFFRSLFLYLKYGPAGKNVFRVWEDISYAKALEMESVGYIPLSPIEGLNRAFELYMSKRRDTPFKFNTHYWELSDGMLEDLAYFLLSEKIELVGVKM